MKRILLPLVVCAIALTTTGASPSMAEGNISVNNENSSRTTITSLSSFVREVILSNEKDKAMIVLKSSRDLLSETENKVLDNSQRDSLQTILDYGNDNVKNMTTTSEIQKLIIDVGLARHNVDMSYNEWLEQDALASELAKQDATANDNSQVVTFSSNASNVDSAMKQRAQDILAQHGCADVMVTWDDPALGQNYGLAYPWDNLIMLSSSMIPSSFDYAVAHECAHVLQFRAYGSTYTGWYDLMDNMNIVYQETGYLGLENNADCIVDIWGYEDQHYTSSCLGDRGAAAQAVIDNTRFNVSQD